MAGKSNQGDQRRKADKCYDAKPEKAMSEGSLCELGVEEMSEGAWEEYRRQMEVEVVDRRLTALQTQYEVMGDEYLQELESPDRISGRRKGMTVCSTWTGSVQAAVIRLW